MLPHFSTVRHYTLLLAILASLSGCRHLQTPIGPENPFSVYLPLERTSVADARLKFAIALSQELAAAGKEPRADAWLHHVEAAASPPEPIEPFPETARTSVLIVPGIFGDCVAEQSLPFSDGVVRPQPANYTLGYGQFASLGFASIRAVMISGRASSSSNAAVLAGEIEREAAKAGIDSILLLAYSKGTSDTLEALELLRARKTISPKVRAFVSLSGVVMGTPIADAAEQLHNLLAAYMAPLQCGQSQGGEVTSLTYRERTKWLASHSIPATVKTFSVVAYTEPEAVAPALRPTYKQLSAIDPRNDGQVLASWSILPDATLLAEVRSDHWLYLLPLERHPNKLVSSMVSQAPFPRDQFFAALLKSVMRSLDPTKTPERPE